MASNSIRKQIIAAIVSKLAVIRTSNGFNTDIGSKVLKASKSNDPVSDIPMCAVWPEDEQAIREYGNVVATMPVRVEGVTELGSSNASDLVEYLLSDILEAMTGPFWAMPFTSGGTAEIVPGNTIIGATSSVTALVMGVTLSTGTWAGGDAAGVFSLRRKTGDFTAENLLRGITNSATTTGVEVYASAIQTTTNNLADDIVYAGGGAGTYPDHNDTLVGAYAIFNIKYKYLNGNPYTQ